MRKGRGEKRNEREGVLEKKRKKDWRKREEKAFQSGKPGGNEGKALSQVLK